MTFKLALLEFWIKDNYKSLFFPMQSSSDTDECFPKLFPCIVLKLHNSSGSLEVVSNGEN